MFYDIYPVDAKVLWEVTGEGDILQEAVNGTYPDLDGYYDHGDECWYLWTYDEDLDLSIHREAIELALGTIYEM